MRGLNEYVFASLEPAFQLDRARILHLRQEAEGGRSPLLRPGPDDLPVFCYQHDFACRDWGRTQRAALLRQDLTLAAR